MGYASFDQTQILKTQSVNYFTPTVKVTFLEPTFTFSLLVPAFLPLTVMTTFPFLAVVFATLTSLVLAAFAEIVSVVAFLLFCAVTLRVTLIFQPFFTET